MFAYVRCIDDTILMTQRTRTISLVKPKLTREEKARQIVESKSVIKITDNDWRVYSQKDPRINYAVNLAYGFRECKDHELTQKDCKHIMAVNLYRTKRIEADLVCAKIRALSKMGIGVVIPR